MKNSLKKQSLGIAEENLNSNLSSEIEVKNEQIVKSEHLKDSPFTIVEAEGKIFGTMAGYRLTEPCETWEQCEKELTNITWNRIVQVVYVMIEKQRLILNDN